MNYLIEKSQRLTSKLDVLHPRYLFNQIDWTQRLIAIKGARGTGKTILLLQYLKSLNLPGNMAIYISLDDFYFTSNSLMDFAHHFYLKGGKILAIDEVHKYPNWSRELKNVYDSYPDLKLVFTSSSILELYKGIGDLSRRLTSYQLYGLSYREFLLMNGNISLEPISLEDVLYKHEEIALDYSRKLRPFEYFEAYLKIGYYPYHLEGEKVYAPKLLQVITMILENDLPSVESIEYESIYKLRKLLYHISVSVPFKPNISKLAEIIQTNRNALMHYFKILEKAELIHQLLPMGRDAGVMRKAEKIYLQNTNMMYALAPGHCEIGQVRECFLLNQLKNAHQVKATLYGDFLVNEKYILEVDGKNKTNRQIKNYQNAFLVKDQIEIGNRQTIPIWLFGMLY